MEALTQFQDLTLLLPLKPKHQSAHESPSPSSTTNPRDVAVSKSLLTWFLHLGQEEGLLDSSLETLPAIALMTLGHVSEGLLCRAVPGTQGARCLCSR